MMNNQLPLSALLARLNCINIELSAFNDVLIDGMSLDSRAIQSGMLFIALQGTQQHGLRFAASAINNGAEAILWESSSQKMPLPETNIPLIEVSNLSAQLGDLADYFYQNPSHSMHMIGITGTDGKTSVSHFVAQALKDDPCAVIGTIGIGLPATMQKATHTTPDAISVHKTLSEQQSNGVKSVAMEVSSHALDQGRVNGVAFDTAILTNLTRDHLDYHKTVEAYAAAKAKLFHWSDLTQVVLNLDDDFGRRLYQELASSTLTRIAYRIADQTDVKAQEHELIATNAHFDHTGIHADIVVDHDGSRQVYPLSASVLGRFNLSNLLASLGALLSRGLTIQQAIQKVQTVTTVPGRMQKVALNDERLQADFLTVIDYAHTPGALASALQALREHTAGKVICVFGCGGDRDIGKRPLMATAVEQYADTVIVTDDNPRSESPDSIFNDIKTGFTTMHSIVFEHDRAKAIRLSIDLAEAGDVVLIAGKGHETEQLFANHRIEFSDYEHAQQALIKRLETESARNTSVEQRSAI